MRTLTNQHSFVLIAVSVLVVEVFALRRWRWARRIAVGATIVAAAAFAIWLRPGTGDITDPGDLDRALASGRPVALKFFSNY